MQAREQGGNRPLLAGQHQVGTDIRERREDEAAQVQAWVGDHDFLSLVERPGLLRGGHGWLLQPGIPAEMIGDNICSIQSTC